MRSSQEFTKEKTAAANSDTFDSESQTEGLSISRNALSAKISRWTRMIGAEEMGVQRIPAEMRTNQHPRDLATIFFAANCNTATLATGYLGPTLFGLGWWDSFLAILFFNVVGALFPAVVATFGPKLGLRTMIIPRYCFGWWPAKVFAFLNAVNQIGWGIVNGISGAQVLYDAGGGHLPLTVAVLLVGLVAIALGFLGYRVLHAWARWSWIAMLICFIVVAGFGAEHFVNVPMGSGSAEASNILSFGTAIVGFQVAWLLIAADYGVYMRETTKAVTSFSWAYLGLITSQLLMEWLGAAVATLGQSHAPMFQDASGIGGLVGAVFEGKGTGVRNFGKFIEVVISFSTAAVVTTNIYSLALSVQMMSTKLMVIPRIGWSLLGSAAFLACAIAGRDHLETVMEDFLLVCAYWIVPFLTVLLAEHFIWRRNYQYDLSAWNDKTRLPYGFAGFITWVVGTVISVLSMSQDWWVGPIAAGVGGSPYGTDISWMLALAVCFIMYVPLRMWEKKRWNV